MEPSNSRGDERGEDIPPSPTDKQSENDSNLVAQSTLGEDPENKPEKQEQILSAVGAPKGPEGSSAEGSDEKSHQPLEKGEKDDENRERGSQDVPAPPSIPPTLQETDHPESKETREYPKSEEPLSAAMETHPDVLHSLEQQRGEDNLLEDDGDETDGEELEGDIPDGDKFDGDKPDLEKSDASNHTAPTAISSPQTDQTEEVSESNDNQRKRNGAISTPTTGLQQKMETDDSPREVPVREELSTSPSDQTNETNTEKPVKDDDEDSPRVPPKGGSSKDDVQSEEDELLSTSETDTHQENTSGGPDNSREEDEDEKTEEQKASRQSTVWERTRVRAAMMYGGIPQYQLLRKKRREDTE
ncbi:hypothetical protein HYALB_00000500 [Hymenoscyphus albidus]|uniref:Uncharacterized protein n=1 Tax=Hymenoscyphus albidus TaxID=595503 RepID=A0A9N9LGC2_9HELO|nr:hypothetical protein HYALB_00000500 [Hymenoscyphus albidus]